MPLRSALFLAGFSVLVGFALPLPASARTWRVAAEGGAEFTAIQPAVDAAGPGDTVLVGAGTYPEFVHISHTKSGIVLRGDAPPELVIIQGDTIAVGLWDTDPPVRLEGFTLTGGDLYGAIYAVGARAEIVNCIVRENVGPGSCHGVGGGGRFALGSEVVIQGCVFEENHEWESPGGLIIWQSRADIRGCIFRNNSACYGGGLEIYHCEGSGTSVIEENLFTGNQAQVWGGAIFNVDSSPVIRRNTFVGNGTGSNGAIFVLGGSPEIVDNFIVGSPHGIVCMGYGGYPPSLPVIGRNLLWGLGDAPALGCADAGEVIAQDPRFCDPGAGDYTVCSDSPAVIDGTIALGAYPVGCDPCGGTESRPSTWGALKARYP